MILTIQLIFKSGNQQYLKIDAETLNLYKGELAIGKDMKNGEELDFVIFHGLEMMEC